MLPLCLSPNLQSLDSNEVRSLLVKGTGRNWGSDKISSLIEDIDVDGSGTIGEMEFLHNTVQWTPAIDARNK
jgi:Ca2+-binding EF-hand superfamily protein